MKFPPQPVSRRYDEVAVRAWILLGLVTLAAGCEDDALYTHCQRAAHCGSRTYDEGDDEVTVYLDCVDVAVEVEPTRTTSGSFCTLPCFSDRDCDSRVGLGWGACIQWPGDAEAFCYQRCEALECYPSSTCERVLLDGDPVDVCLPGR